jgi:hypothetical protein
LEVPELCPKRWDVEVGSRLSARYFVRENRLQPKPLRRGYHTKAQASKPAHNRD